LYGFGEGPDVKGEHQGTIGATRAGQNLNEKSLERKLRALDNDLVAKTVAFETEDKKFNESRQQLREAVLERKRVLSGEGGPFSFAWQMDIVRQRLERLYNDAQNRAFIAKEGLEKIYARSTPQLPVDRPIIQAVSELAIWVRECIEWLAAYGQRDQAFTRVVSLKSCLSATDWLRFQQSTTHYSEHIAISENLFTAYDNIRLRGLGASIVGKAGVIPWSITLKPPERAIYQTGTARRESDQTRLPRCLLGRVENRNSLRSIELCGMISLMNASPIGMSPDGDAGRWFIEVVPPTSGESYANIEDLLLEYSLVGIPRTEAHAS
jgi:hypothetical protein